MRALDIPLFFSLAAQLRNLQSGQHRWVTRDTDIVIEGFPRSANTFLHRIVRAATGDSLRIGHHVHRPQQIGMALRYNIPTFALFRHPLDAVASYLVREPRLTVNRCLVGYLRFAETTLAEIDHPRLHVLTFDEVIADPIGVGNAILAQINRPPVVTSTLITAATLDKRKDHRRSSLPNPKKDALKQNHIFDIKKAPDFETAERLYWFVTERAWQH